jgi:hypothetical protein
MLLSFQIQDVAASKSVPDVMASTGRQTHAQVNRDFFTAASCTRRDFYTHTQLRSLLQRVYVFFFYRITVLRLKISAFVLSHFMTMKLPMIRRFPLIPVKSSHKLSRYKDNNHYNNSTIGLAVTGSQYTKQLLSLSQSFLKIVH